MNLVVEFINFGGAKEALRVDKRGRYHLDGKPISVGQAFRWYARKSASSNMSEASGSHPLEARLLVARLLK